MLPDKCLKCPFKNVKKSEICKICIRDNLNGIVDINKTLKDWNSHIRRNR